MFIQAINAPPWEAAETTGYILAAMMTFVKTATNGMQAVMCNPRVSYVFVITLCILQTP